MALTTKRIINLDNAGSVANDDYIVLDGSTNGTRKYATSGKALSTEDYTTAEKTKLAGIATGAEVNVQADWTENDSSSDAYIANKPSLATVATSGAYSDLSGTPSLATVATSGSYTDLSNKPVIDSTLDETSTNAVENKAVATEVNKKANIDGYYENLGAGTAEQLISSVYEEDSEPYNFRTSGGSTDIGNRETDEIVGGTIAWNQLIPSTNNFDTYLGTKSFSDGVITFTATSSISNNAQVYYSTSLLANHKYLALAQLNPSVSVGMELTFYGSSTQRTPAVTLSANTWTQWGGIVGTTAETTQLSFFVNRTATMVEGDTISLKNIMLIDLTQMFGSTIADYVYSLEQAETGKGVAWFKALFPKDYYAYNAGELMSVKTTAHEMVGFNQWDEEWENGTIDTSTGQNTTNSSLIRSKNYIPIIPNTSYYAKAPASSGGNIFYYDADKNYISYVGMAVNVVFTTPQNAHYMRFRMGSSYGTTYNNDICINLSWSGYRNGEYEPYVKHTYALDSDLELRGIPKLDANNKWYYDGDTYESDGTVTRKYGIVDLGTLTWSYDSTNLYFSATLRDSTVSRTGEERTNLVCSKYPPASNYGATWDSVPDKTIIKYYNMKAVCIKDSAYTNASEFATAMSGVYLVYELATPTTETADAYTNPQIVNDFGTEEYVDSRAVAVPVGHNTQYMANLRDKLQHLPDLADSDGYYMIKQTSNDMSLELFRIPKAPTTDGTYTLKTTVSGGTPTYTWEAVE